MAGMNWVGSGLRYAWKEIWSAPHHSECCHWHVLLDWRAWPLKYLPRLPQVRNTSGMAYEFQAIKNLNPKLICVRFCSILFLPSEFLLLVLPTSVSTPGQQCGADVSELVLRLLDDSDNVMLNGKALNVLAKSSWQRGLQLLQSMVRRKVGARDRWLSDGGHGFLGFTLW